MHVLIAPNAFKNSLSAEDSAEAIKRGLERSRLTCTCQLFPIGDGGDGTGKLLIDHYLGERVKCTVQGPLGRNVEASFGVIQARRTAVIEMAEASGLRLLRSDELNPLQASSFGTGQLIKRALDLGVSKIILSMGGSATVDGGMGILKALGLRFLTASGEELIEFPEDLSRLECLDETGLDRRIFNCEVVIACDVENELLGPKGSAAVFAPQKGASEEELLILEAGLSVFRDVVLKSRGLDIGRLRYGGAAGGAAAGLHAMLGAKLQSGADLFLTMTGFDDALRKSGLLITGEGSIDDQTLQGKGPFAVALRAKALGIPVIGLAGKIPKESVFELRKHFDVLFTIGQPGLDTATALRNTWRDLIRTAEQVGNNFALAQAR